MNIKAGLIRLFIASTILIGVVGYFIGARYGNETQTYFYGAMISAVNQLDTPECQAIVAKNPVEITSPSGEGAEKCSKLEIFWSQARAHHIKQNRVGLVDAQDIRDSYQDVWGNYTITSGLYKALSLIIGYWIILVVVMLMFFVCRWVWRGFKNK